jgi:hypothetical protein
MAAGGLVHSNRRSIQIADPVDPARTRHHLSPDQRPRLVSHRAGVVSKALRKGSHEILGVAVAGGGGPDFGNPAMVLRRIDEIATGRVQVPAQATPRAHPRQSK